MVYFISHRALCYTIQRHLNLDDINLGNDSGGLAAGELLQAGGGERQLDERGKALLGVQPVLRLVSLVLLDVEADSGPGTAGAREAEDDAAAVGEHEPQALLLSHAPVDGIRVLKVVRDGHLVGPHLGPGGGLGLHLTDVVHHGVGLVALARLVVVAREEVPPVRLPVLHGHILHRHELAVRGNVLVLVRQDGQPRQHRPDAVLLADVIGSGAEGLLAADGELAGIHEVAEELPPSGRLKEGHAHLLCNTVQGSRGGHGPRQTLDARLEVGDGSGIGGDHGYGVGGRDEEVVAQDHVAVAVTVAGRTEGGRVLREHGRHELLCVRQVRVRVPTTEVLEGGVVDQGRGRRPQLVDEDGRSVRAGHRVHGVELHAEVGPGQQRLDHVEVEALLQELQVVGHAVDHLHLKVAELRHANLGEVHVGDVRHVERGHLLSVAVDLVSDLLGRGLAASVVELDAPVLVRARGVVTGRHDKAAVRLALADDGGGCGRGEDAVLPDVHLAHAVAGRQLQDDLRRLLVEVAPVTAQDHAAALELLLRERAEEGLHPVGEVVLAHEHLRLLAQPARAGRLPRDRRRRDRLHRNCGMDGEGLASSHGSDA
mmetsp:Transcript_40488/g.67824  ORF Transcript_40488/g.67824 Transcript_40488/m.67824 type:complete len:598 (+) Transcript_40488:91-1884(+)